MNPTTRIICALALSVALSPTAAQAQLFDHLKCFKVKDEAKFNADATLEALQAEYGIDSCKIKGKAKLYCVPTDKQLDSFEDKSKTGIPQVSVDGPEYTFDRVCYKVKCDDTPPASELVTDQFGSRTVSKLKTQMLCTPALKGDTLPCPALTAPANGSIGYSDGTAPDSVASYSCDGGHALGGGDRLRTCVSAGSGAPGTWTGVAPTCGELTCDPVSAPANGVVIYDNPPPFPFGTTVTYACDPGFEPLGGDTVRTCVEDETCMITVWSGTAPVCAPMLP